MDKLWTCSEIAKHYSVEIATVWKWVRHGKLKATRIGKGYRVKQSDLDEFENANATNKNEEE